MTTRFQDGLTPFDQGASARAREIWLPLGEKGDSDAVKARAKLAR